jgi:hypothetical protein
MTVAEEVDTLDTEKMSITAAESADGLSRHPRHCNNGDGLVGLGLDHKIAAQRCVDGMKGCPLRRQAQLEMSHQGREIKEEGNTGKLLAAAHTRTGYPKWHPARKSVKEWEGALVGTEIPCFLLAVLCCAADREEQQGGGMYLTTAVGPLPPSPCERP